jgi:Uma2 family endonuclease
MATVETLLTAKEYWLMPDNGQPTELVRGRIVPVNMPAPRHGQVCAKVAYLLQRYLEDDDLGHVASNDSGVQTEHDPDTVRGADVSFYSYSQFPKGPLPLGYLEVSPRVVFEVKSTSDRWAQVLAKVAEYLEAGVVVVCVLDPQTDTAHVYRADQPAQILQANDELALPDVLGSFRVVVRRFFE